MRDVNDLGKFVIVIVRIQKFCPAAYPSNIKSMSLAKGKSHKQLDCADFHVFAPEFRAHIAAVPSKGQNGCGHMLGLRPH